MPISKAPSAALKPVGCTFDPSQPDASRSCTTSRQNNAATDEGSWLEDFNDALHELSLESAEADLSRDVNKVETSNSSQIVQEHSFTITGFPQDVRSSLLESLVPICQQAYSIQPREAGKNQQPGPLRFVEFLPDARACRDTLEGLTYRDCKLSVSPISSSPAPKGQSLVASATLIENKTTYTSLSSTQDSLEDLGADEANANTKKTDTKSAALQMSPAVPNPPLVMAHSTSRAQSAIAPIDEPGNIAVASGGSPELASVITSSHQSGGPATRPIKKLPLKAQNAQKAPKDPLTPVSVTKQIEAVASSSLDSPSASASLIKALPVHPIAAAPAQRPIKKLPKLEVQFVSALRALAAADPETAKHEVSIKSMLYLMSNAQWAKCISQPDYLQEKVRLAMAILRDE